MMNKYHKGFDKIEIFLQTPTTIPTKEITLFFKELSSNIAILEKHKRNLRVNMAKLDSIRKHHEEMNKLIVKETWGSNPSEMKYSDDDKNNIKKEYSIITSSIEELRFELYK